MNPLAQIDPSVFAALQAGTISPEQVVAAISEIEAKVLEECLAELVTRGLPATLVRLVVEQTRAAWLSERPGTCATLRLMVEAGVSNVQ